MKKAVSDLYAQGLKLYPDYVRDVLKLSGEQARKVEQISGGIHPDEAEFLAARVAEASPLVSLEIGLGYGFSALTICANGPRASGRRHIVIDPHQTRHWRGQGMQNLVEAGFGDIVELQEEPSYRALPRLEQAGEKVDFAFVDGWHTFDFVFVDAFYIDKLLKVGGVIVFDDADWPAVRPVLRYLVTNLGYSPVGAMPEKKQREALDVTLGLEGSCIALRKPSPRDREIFFHEAFY